MKKLLSFFAAGLLAVGSLGVMSCSGDLQDNDVQPLAIVGITNDPGNHVIPMTLDKPDGSEQSLKITFKDGFELLAADGKKYKLTDDYNGSWRQNNGNGPIIASRFKVIPPSAIKADGTPSWADDYGSLNGEDVQYLIAGETFSKVGRRGDKGVSGDPKHIVFDSVIAGETYILRAKYDSVKGSLELKLDGTADNPTEMKINIVGESKNFPAKDKDDKDLSYSMSKAGSTYTYQFIAKADETLSFHLTNAMAGTLGGTLSTTASYLAVNEATPTNMSLAVKKNVEYKITVDASKGIAKATIKYEVVDMLKDAKVNGTFKYAENSYSDDTTKIESNCLVFKAERSEMTFYVERSSGGVWGKDSVASIKPGDEAVTLKYITDELDESGKVKKTAVENVVPVTLKNLTVGNYHILTLKNDNTTFELTAKVEVARFDVNGCTLKGAWDGWWGNSVTLNSNSTQVYTVQSTGEHDSDGINGQWGIFNGSDKNILGATDVPFGTRTLIKWYPAGKPKKDGHQNNTMNASFDRTKKYTIKLEITDTSDPTNPIVYITITEAGNKE